MKKTLILFTVALMLLLCSCRKTPQNEAGLEIGNSSELNSNYQQSSEISLPDRPIFSSISTTTTSSETSSQTSNESSSETSTSTSSQSSSSSTTSSNSSNTSDYKHQGENENIESVIADDSFSIEADSSYYLNSSKTIGFNLYNKKHNFFTYYTDFFLQIEVDGKWEYVTTKNEVIEYKYDTGESTSRIKHIILNLEELYRLPLMTGSYRIIQECDDFTIVSNQFQVVEKSFFDGEPE